MGPACAVATYYYAAPSHTDLTVTKFSRTKLKVGALNTNEVATSVVQNTLNQPLECIASLRKISILW